MEGDSKEKELEKTLDESKGTYQETEKTDSVDIQKDDEKSQSSDSKQEAIIVPPVSNQQENTPESLENQNQIVEVQKEILTELQKLNEGTTEFKDYVEERNNEQDEKETQAQELVDAEKEETADSYSSLLSALTDLSAKFDTYTEQNAEILAYMENIEFNTSYGLAFDAVLTGFLSLVAGIFFGRVAFRKL